MKIVVLSDTHMTKNRIYLPKALLQGLDGADLILHAGDWLAPEVADLLEEWAPVDGVAGNNDGEEIVRRFGLQKLIRAGSHMIGLIHGDTGPGRTTEQRAYQAFAGEAVDAILFGHSHVPYQEERDGVLLFNPGSPTDKRRQPLYSYGVLETGPDGRLHARHVFYEDKS
ncbi:metallophosphoesterase family protein [Gorillibacterium sp. sgz5001074]|uniref:metallophosphoesterase family protein n=1 Tax=Gorillibacterium sp. sgz5001074 TaxID=3446695 RepID=UPI003F66CA77